MQQDLSGLEARGRRLERLFAIIFWLGALWLFAEAYVPLKHVGSALLRQEGAIAAGLFQSTFFDALAALALLGALWSAKELFGGFARGQALSDSSATHLKRLGLWLAAAGSLMLFGASGYLATGQSSGQAPLFGAPLMVLVIGLAIHLLGDVLRVSAEIKAEHDQIV
jgi:hypothetical protein